MPKYNARKDANQTEIVNHLRRCGVSVFVTHTLGGGFPDIVCGFRGKNYHFEIKDPAQPPSKRRLTDDEQKHHHEWRGQVEIIETAEDALWIMGALDNAN